jgi:hypothetical protein
MEPTSGGGLFYLQQLIIRVKRLLS